MKYFFAVLFATALISAGCGSYAFAQEHSATAPETHAQQDAHSGTDKEAIHQDEEAHAEGEHEGGHHDLSKLTPSEEMFNILEHKVANTDYIHEYPFPTIEFPQDWIVNIGGIEFNFSLNRHIVYMILSAIITFILMMLAVRQNKKNRVPKGWGSMIEATVKYVRDEIAEPFLGHDAPRYLYILLTFFFFILAMNLVGLLPFGAASTGNINVTAGLAIVSLGFMVGGGMRAKGVWGFMKGLVPSGLPWPLCFILAPIEVMSVFTKPFALAIRLFANMVSGGLLIGAFYALIFGLDTVGIAPVSIAFLIAMTLLKIFVCFVQAYVFTILSSFFIGMYVHSDH